MVLYRKETKKPVRPTLDCELKRTGFCRNISQEEKKITR